MNKNINIIKDIEPYIASDGKIINSRSEHREHLKRTGSIEVGNEDLVKNAQRIREAREKESREFNNKITQEYIKNYDPNREYRKGEWRTISERIRDDISSKRNR